MLTIVLKDETVSTCGRAHGGAPLHRSLRAARVGTQRRQQRGKEGVIAAAQPVVAIFAHMRRAAARQTLFTLQRWHSRRRLLFLPNGISAALAARVASGVWRSAWPSRCCALIR